jgi:hypothetical protein
MDICQRDSASSPTFRPAEFTNRIFPPCGVWITTHDAKHSFTLIWR